VLNIWVVAPPWARKDGVAVVSKITFIDRSFS
jgi:hypothetical protein